MFRDNPFRPCIMKRNVVKIECNCIYFLVRMQSYTCMKKYTAMTYKLLRYGLAFNYIVIYQYGMVHVVFK